MKHKVLTSTLTVFSLLAFVAIVAVSASSQTGSTTAGSQVSATQVPSLGQLQQVERQLDQDRAAVHAAIAEHGIDSSQTRAARAQLLQDRNSYRNLRRSLAPGSAARAGFGRGGAMGWMGRGGRRAGGRCPCMRQCPYARW
jgi:hypothetical protein